MSTEETEITADDPYYVSRQLNKLEREFSQHLRALLQSTKVSRKYGDWNNELEIINTIFSKMTELTRAPQDAPKIK